MVKTKISMTIEQSVFESFKEYCKNNGMKVSTKVEQMMKESVKDSSLNSFIK
ncbi:MAG: hypothetical protein GY861_29075 [bacterium]|nr:hypothetical protein [bacterium]